MCNDLIKNNVVRNKMRKDYINKLTTINLRKMKRDYLNNLIAVNLRKVRKASGKTQTKVAKDLNIFSSHLCQNENGKLKLSAARLFEIAEYFNVPMESFINEVKND